jgi:CubicO group peptidase (beta-lactamase class C family)
VKFRGAILVSIAGEPVFKRGFGPRIPDSPPGSAGAKPIDADSIYEIASIAKPFTAIAILRLVEQKKLSLDDEATRWLSPAANPADTASPLRGITIRHLLSHSSGLDNDTGISPYAEPSRDAAVAKFLASKVQTKPGEKFAYNNAGYIMLAVILEKVSGKSFEQCMRDEVFTPAGMTSSGFPPGDTLDATQSVQRKPGITMLTHPWGWGYRGCGGILTTLNDLTKFDRALRDGKLLSPESIEVMSRPVVKAEGPTPRGSYALGWFVDQTPDGRARLWHSGGSFGVRANLVRIPESEVLIVALCDDTAEPFAMTTLAERLVLKELPRREAGTRPPSPGAAPVP